MRRLWPPDFKFRFSGRRISSLRNLQKRPENLYGVRGCFSSLKCMRECLETLLKEQGI
jgi:hypothetical protein